MRNDAPGVHVGQAALDARNNFQFALDVPGDGFSGEKRPGAVGVLGKSAKTVLEFRC
jgi:hypothetical protein